VGTAERNYRIGFTKRKQLVKRRGESCLFVHVLEKEIPRLLLPERLGYLNNPKGRLYPFGCIRGTGPKYQEYAAMPSLQCPVK
jgi:hypothetical protein